MLLKHNVGRCKELSELCCIKISWGLPHYFPRSNYIPRYAYVFFNTLFLPEGAGQGTSIFKSSPVGGNPPTLEVVCGTRYIYYMYCYSLPIYHRSNVNVNDALGDYSLTLVDTLDTLVVS